MNTPDILMLRTARSAAVITFQQSSKLDFGHFGWGDESNVMRSRIRLNLRLQVYPEHRFGVEMADDWSFKTAHVKLAGWMTPFDDLFTAPTWQRVLVLLIGAILSPRTPDRSGSP